MFGVLGYNALDASSEALDVPLERALREHVKCTF